jgi:hypothetical protein
VPEERYEAVTAQVNAHPEVAHNYRRDHALNMWFVLGTERRRSAPPLERIEAETGLPVLAFPKEREFFVELKLPLDERSNPWRLTIRPRADRRHPGGLPLVPRPYDAVGAMLGVSGEQVRERLAQMLAEGLVRRIGAVPNHYRWASPPTA